MAFLVDGGSEGVKGERGTGYRGASPPKSKANPTRNCNAERGTGSGASGRPLCYDHVGYILVVNHLLLTQLGSGMSLDVFLSFRRCPKHPNTPPFDFGTPNA